MNQEEIKGLLPHRDNMLLVDEAEALSSTEARGSYTIRGNEWFLQGHFPGDPVVPGVILCEIMAQTCCVLLAGQAGCGAGKREALTPYFTSLNNVRFKNMVRPGDVLQIHCTVTRSKGPFTFAKGTGSVDGRLCVSGEFSFALLPRGGANR